MASVPSGMDFLAMGVVFCLLGLAGHRGSPWILQVHTFHFSEVAR